jgi:hypothetical protein
MIKLESLQYICFVRNLHTIEKQKLAVYRVKKQMYYIYLMQSLTLTFSFRHTFLNLNNTFRSKCAPVFKSTPTIIFSNKKVDQMFDIIINCKGFGCFEV